MLIIETILHHQYLVKIVLTDFRDSFFFLIVLSFFALVNIYVLLSYLCDKHFIYVLKWVTYHTNSKHSSFAILYHAISYNHVLNRHVESILLYVISNNDVYIDRAFFLVQFILKKVLIWFDANHVLMLDVNAEHDKTLNLELRVKLSSKLVNMCS